ncbi:tetratricopeptide repeat protein 17-like isoform X2 [Gigantopelta aegis]|uniref:tetratricopeptide repeat protein 17-like isoform X2 n=1 Tax=Gigantopelta aegis TaxID=1735272 RepID=UPI001B88B0AA|nr:tetratricopeptide repeat protein 17-like isoform X2 [Gigantopelta aegis]
MATTMVVVLVVNLILEQCLLTSGSTHWIVTENGRVQSQPDTVFNMQRPYDLVAFMKQEDRAVMLNNLKKELLNRKDEIDKNEDRDTGLEQRFYKTDLDCIEAGKPLPEFDLYISTVLPLENKRIRPEEHIDMNAPPTDPHVQPDCMLVTDLDFSMHTFEHLEGLKDRSNLSGTPELGLKNAITHRENVDDYGYLVYEALQKNKTSWVLYNMAAFYWRIKGEPYQAIECVRRALHYSPRYQKDVALISLANILHRARYSNEAAIVVHAALDVSKELNVNHFTLGNIYAVLGEYNKSVICFENTQRIQPDFEAAAKRKFAVLCHSKLESALEAQHKSLQRTLKDLKDYQNKHDIWQTQNDKLSSEQVIAEVKIAQSVAYEQQKIKRHNAEIGEYCRMVDREGKQVLLCTWSRRSPSLDFEFGFLDEDAAQQKANEIPKYEEYSRKKHKKKNDYSKPVRPPLYTKDRIVAPKMSSEHMIEAWPSKEECDMYVQKVPDPRNLSTIYLSPENKGFEVKALLNEAQNLKPTSEHPLPWYPPVCVPLMDLPEGSVDIDKIKTVTFAERSRIPLKVNDPSMRPILLEHVPGPMMTEEEIGQRILTALKEHIEPSWILYNLAGMYWRIIGNNYHAIECIRRAIHLVPPKYKDVPLVNIANIFYKYGRFEDAVIVLREALSVNPWEPQTHFFFGNVLWASKNYTGAVWHYRESMDGDPANEDCLNTLRAIRCHQKYHQTAQSVAPTEMLSQPVGVNCQQKVINNKQQTESRVICKTENGEEKCVIETRSRQKSPDCNGHCTQTCTVTPVKMDTCSGGASEGNTVAQCVQKGPTTQCAGDGDDVLYNSDFTGKLDEVSQYYEMKGLCRGDECSQLRVQCVIPMKTHSGLLAHVITPPKLFVRPVALHTTQCMGGGQKPHVKLEFVDGVLHQKLIFVQSPGDLHIEDDECVIFNDGTKSEGCNQPEYRAYDFQQDLDSLKQDVEVLELLLSKHFNAKCKKVSKESTVSDQKQPLASESFDVNVNWVEKSEEKPSKEIELPDTSIHVKERYKLDWGAEDCTEIENIEFRQFTSTWLSVSAKGIDLNEHVDFETTIKRNLHDPLCDPEKVSTLIGLDHLPGVAYREELDYSPELGLKEVLQKLSGEEEPVEVVGTRIYNALQKNSTSWVLTNLAALYWRVEGDAAKAIDCLRLSLTYAPRHLKDTSLISLANILYRAGHLAEGIIVSHMALETSNSLPVSHFTIANIYAAQSDWPNAVMFYESTLGLQTLFKPAKDRLKAILCQKLLENPP